MEKLFAKYNVREFLPLDEFIDYLKENYPDTEKSCETAENKPSEEHENQKEKKGFVPDKEYVKMLIQNLNALKDKMTDTDYSRCIDKISEILDTGNFDDAEEIMEGINDFINKCIYGYSTKVSLDDWKLFEEYIAEAGYTPVEINSGDDIKKYILYFEGVLSTEGGIPGTIKKILLKPYNMYYYDKDDDKMKEIRLCGKCTYYK